MKKREKRTRSALSLVASTLLLKGTLCMAAPSGGEVVAGSATIDQVNNTTNITQTTNKASINWQDFSIASDEAVNFIQPSSSSITLNRVVGTNKSIIDGMLNANGQVFILNQNGVLFGKNAKVNTAGLVASTKKLLDEDFMSGNYSFKGDSRNSVINKGTINITDEGYALLLADDVLNEGVIQAVQGKIHLISGDEVAVNLNGNSLIELSINKSVLDALVRNKGAVYANGGEIYLTTNSVDSLLKSVVNNTGIIEANSIEEKDGKIVLFAHNGLVKVDGTLQAKEGFIETSGKEFDIENSANIEAKTWLIDPTNITISDASAYETALGNGTDTIIQTQNDGSEEGNIYVNDSITWNAASKLTLDAHNSIYINEDITAQHTNGQVALHYGQKDVEASNSANYFIKKGKAINLQAGNNFFTKLGSDGGLKSFSVINDWNSMMSINTSNLNGNYALGSNLSSAYPLTNPIGYNDFFTGTFDGLGHTINNIFAPNDYLRDRGVGLFPFNKGTIQNLSFNIIFYNFPDISSSLAGLSTENKGTIFNVHAKTEMRNGLYMLGGLVNVNYGDIINSSAEMISNTVADHHIGGLVALNEGNIENSYTTGNILQSSEGAIGGLVAENTSTGTIKNSYSHIAVKGKNTVGGVVGINLGEISNSYNTGDVTGTNKVGGVAGSNYNKISNSYNTGNVIGTNYVGGIAGINSGDDSAEIINSYSIGFLDAINTGNNFGGIVGYNSGTIQNSYFKGKLTESGSVQYMGALAGTNTGTIQDSFSILDKYIIKTSNDFKGAAVGYLSGTLENSFVSLNTTNNTIRFFVASIEEGGEIINSYYNSDTFKGINNPTFAKSTQELQSIQTFNAWDIQIDRNHDAIYPFLAWSSDNSGAYTAKWVIGKTPLNFFLTNHEKTYDGTVTQLSTLWDAKSIFGDYGESLNHSSDYRFIYNNTASTRLQKNVGEYSNISVEILHPDYILNSGNTAKVTVKPKEVSLNASKIYDGTKNLDGFVHITTGVNGERLNYQNALAHTDVIGDDNFIESIILKDSTTALASNYILPTLNTQNAQVSILRKPIVTTKPTDTINSIVSTASNTHAQKKIVLPTLNRVSFKNSIVSIDNEGIRLPSKVSLDLE
jgi:filamentous hemagglutinin family protein